MTEGFDNTIQSADLDSPSKSNRPRDSKLRQQKLPAWQPILTAGTVVPSFFIIGLIFLPLGIALYVSSEGIFERIIPYTDCKESASAKAMCKDVVNMTNPKPCKCKITLNIPKNVHQKVYFYYGLTNYYQNHRRYVKSRNDFQLLGDLGQTDMCEPYETVNKQKIAPCGAIANSLFTDTFTLMKKNNKIVNMTWKGVVWRTDRSNKFNNPSNMEDFKSYAKPPLWDKPVYELDPANKENNGFLNTDLIVWMRTAALPTFRKLYRVMSDAELEAGDYILEIDYKYLVKSFGGEKRFILSTTSWVGGKNSFLGVAYIVVGSLCIVLALMFLGIHLKFGKSLTEMSQVTGRP